MASEAWQVRQPCHRAGAFAAAWRSRWRGPAKLGRQVQHRKRQNLRHQPATEAADVHQQQPVDSYSPSHAQGQGGVPCPRYQLEGPSRCRRHRPSPGLQRLHAGCRNSPGTVRSCHCAPPEKDICSRHLHAERLCGLAVDGQCCRSKRRCQHASTVRNDLFMWCFCSGSMPQVEAHD